MPSPTFVVSGGRPLTGTVRPAGNKNAVLPILAAGIQWTGINTVTIDPRKVEPKELDPALSARIRASILLAGPMLARFGRVTLPPPGGDVIGRRRIDTHFLALERMGAEVTVGDR